MDFCVVAGDGGPTIRRMQVREAKDFLVQQMAERVRIEGVPLSELEKRMIYFTERGCSYRVGRENVPADEKS